MGLETLLLLVAFRNRICEPNLESGLMCFAAVVGRDIDPGDFQAAVTHALAADYIHDPVQLPEGALQCHWHLGLTSKGVNKVRVLVQDQEKSVDELIAS
jgi:hypothetical protein